MGNSPRDRLIYTGQFSLEGYHLSYPLDISNRRGRLLVYVNASIPTRQLKYEIKY